MFRGYHSLHLGSPPLSEAQPLPSWSALRTYSRQIKGDLAKEIWPILKDCGVGGVTAAMNATGVTVFVPLQIADSDWDLILDSLATRAPQSN